MQEALKRTVEQAVVAMEAGFSGPQDMVGREMQQDCTQTVIDHALNPRNLVASRGAEGRAKHRGSCGDTMEVRPKISCENVVDAGFWSDGC